MEKKKILGFRKFNSKTGKPFCIVQTSSPFTDRELEHGACGEKIEEVWLPEDFHKIINPQVVGKKLCLTYSIQSGKAYINGVTIE